MSFVYAEKKNDTIDIYCDTKMGFDNFAGASFSEEQLKCINKYGIVKITLICPEIGIGFAGNNIYLASELFYRLYDKRVFTTNDVVEMAYDIHMRSKDNDIEFIIASCENGSLSLHCIKERMKFCDCPFAWIGSPVAHKEFQVLRNQNNLGKASDRTSTAFLEVVQTCSDETVGGFCISAGYNSWTKTLGFRERKTFQTSKEQMVKPGDAVKFYMDAEDGGFSFEQIPCSIEDLLLIIDQMEPAVLYSRRLRMNERDIKNTQLFSFMLPMVVYEDEAGNWKRVQ